MAGTATTPQEAMDTLKRVNTGTVIDALAMAGFEGGIRGVRPARGFEDARIVGPAATVLFAPPRPGTPGLSNFQVIREVAPGSVLVIDGKGKDGHFTGDNQGAMARRRGLVAVVVYGGARDIAGYRELGMPLYCTGSSTRNKPSGLQVTAYNVPIEIGGVPVKPGDIIVADEDGVVAVPLEALGAVMENLKTIREVEAAMGEAIGRDAPLEEIMAILARRKLTK